jgi:cardiolipin synthase
MAGATRVSSTGRYRARDLLRVPSLLSLARLPLAACFPWVVARPLAAFALLAAAGMSDVLDGWYARRFRQVTATGSAIDPLTDKLFVLTVAITLVVKSKLSAGEVLLLSTREIGELPLIVWLLLNDRARGARAEQPGANVPGKVATAAQFAAISAALFGVQHVAVCVALTSIAGAFAALTYWKRALQIASRLR